MTTVTSFPLETVPLEVALADFNGGVVSFSDLETPTYESAERARLVSVPARCDTLRTSGYSLPGDGGGALYKRVGSEPSHAGKIQSADGAWWELAEPTLSVKMFGAVGDGSTDDTSAVTAAITAAGSYPAYVPPGSYDTTLANFASFRAFYGPGRLKDSSDRFLPNLFAKIDAEPARGNEAGLLTAFNGDAPVPFAKRGLYVTGAATMGQPSSGYLFTPETALQYDWVHYTSGHQENKANGEGRTGFGIYRPVITHRGWGDTHAFVYNVQVFGPTVNDATNMLSQPAGGFIAGTSRAFANNVGVNFGEYHIEDGGFDVRGIGFGFIFNRNNAAGTNYQWWEGFRLYSNGSEPVDCGVNLVSPSGLGGYKVGFATSGTRLTTNIALALGSGQKIEFFAQNPIGVGTGGLNRYPETLNGWTQGYTPASGSIPAGIRYETPAGRKMIIADDHVRVGNGSDTDQIFRVYGASTTAHVAFSMSGINGIVGAYTSSNAEATNLLLRTADNTGSETTRLAITGADGTVRAGADNAQDFGSAAVKWKDVYANRYFAGSASFQSGSNTPEGAVSAPVGSLFGRTDGGAGTSAYLKESGSGDTGWKAFLTETVIGSTVQAYDADLAALAANSTNGIWARTGSGAGSARTITGTSNQITVTNGDGVSGNPTVSIPDTVVVASSTAFRPTHILRNEAADANGGSFTLRKARGSSGAGSAVQAEDSIGSFVFQGADSAGAMQNGALLAAIITSVASGSVAAKFRFTSGSSITELSGGVFNLPSGGSVQVNSTQVVGSRKTGWATASGTATRTTFDTSTVTTAQLAERVKALIDDLHGTAGHGLIGT